VRAVERAAGFFVKGFSVFDQGLDPRDEFAIRVVCMEDCADAVVFGE
jgi:hypothetical protein